MSLHHYANPQKPRHGDNVAMFQRIEEEFPLGYFMPSKALAPWHVQAKLTSAHGYTILLQFWPCAAKAQRDGEKVVEGEAAIREMIRQAIDDAANPDGFDDGGRVIE